MTGKRDTVEMGAVYGRLTIIEELPRKNTKRMFLCKCACGKFTEVYWPNLKRGASTSCGCYAREINTIHGGGGTRLYTTWWNMIRRCTDPNNNVYAYYGGKGIGVYEEWKDFTVFREWAMANGYNDKLTIERKDISTDYCPDNCFWADLYDQAANRQKRTTSSSPYLGVNPWGKTGKSWVATITSHGKRTKVGVYNSPEEARDARNQYIHDHQLPHMPS